MATTNERQAKFRQAMKARGMVQVTVWVHKSQEGELRQMSRRLLANPDLVPGPIRNLATNRFESIEREPKSTKE